MNQILQCWFASVWLGLTEPHPDIIRQTLKSTALWEQPGHSGEHKSIWPGELADNGWVMKLWCYYSLFMRKKQASKTAGQNDECRNRMLYMQEFRLWAGAIYFKFVEKKKKDFSQHCWRLGNWPAIRKKRLKLDSPPLSLFSQIPSRWLRDVNVKIKSRDI